jgi:hypothetical protein
MKIRVYQAPRGRVDDIDVAIEDSQEAAQAAAMAQRHVYPTVEILRTGECSVTLEADDLEEDLTCDLVQPADVARAIHRMIMVFDPAAYDRRTVWDD